MGNKIVITGGAGLVGQNLTLMLTECGYDDICVIDKHANNLQLLSQLNPTVKVVCADVTEPGPWIHEFRLCSIAVILHAQITAKESSTFVRNNIDATKSVLAALNTYSIPYSVHVSSSVVNSIANDDYTKTKKIQEELFLASGLSGCVLRPTLMYGWFDPKHFGWLSRFMEKSPIFPVPGHGRYMRQPLFERDFCRAIIWCIENRPKDKIYDLVGQERIDYIDIIRAIRQVKGLKTPIIKIPYHLFGWLLRLYALFSDKPPFTVSQLKALTAGDDFIGVDIEQTFGFKPTPLMEGIRETFCHPVYSSYVVERT